MIQLLLKEIHLQIIEQIFYAAVEDNLFHMKFVLYRENTRYNPNVRDTLVLLLEERGTKLEVAKRLLVLGDTAQPTACFYSSGSVILSYKTRSKLDRDLINRSNIICPQINLGRNFRQIFEGQSSPLKS